MEYSDGFIWGVATASYQIEGAAFEDGRGESIWDRFSHTPGKILQGHTGDVACNHYHLYKEDVALLKELGVDSYRFSIAWPRIFPQGSGQLNHKGLDFYRRLVEELLRQGIKPAATLYHWDLPQVLEDQGGWLNRDTAYRFRDFAAVMFQELQGLVDSWITLNEPWCSAHLGYGTGEHAPGKQCPSDPFIASHTLLLGHGLAVQAYRDLNLKEPIGITLNLAPQYPVSEREDDRRAALIADGQQNRWYLEPLFRGQYPDDLLAARKIVDPVILPGDLELISAPMDFLGINYYSRGLIKADAAKVFTSVPGPGPKTAMGWEVYPEGLYDLLMRVHRDYGPIPLFITENGAAYNDELVNGEVQDFERLDYLGKHFEQAARAVADGVPLKGYYVWSLFDNFEWAFGYERRFGIVYVDFATQKRIKKASAKWFQQFLQERRL